MKFISYIFISLTVVSQSFWTVCIVKEVEFHSLALFRVGGSMPVVFSYFSEYFTPRKKGPFVIILASFWMLGQIYTALLAWVLLSRPCAVNAQIGSLTLRSWRVFVMLCTVPALSAALCFIFLPESPSWLHQVCHSINQSLLKCTLPNSTRAPHGSMHHWVQCSTARIIASETVDWLLQLQHSLLCNIVFCIITCLHNTR